MLRRTVLAAVMMLLVARLGYGQASVGRAAIMVVVYNETGVPEADLAKAERQAAQVLRRAGVNVIWANRSFGSITGTRCTQTADGVACLSVHILRQPMAAGGDVFGMAFVDPGAIGKYIDVFYGRVQALGSENLDASGVLGHVIAHETGHLLLGVQSHSKIGIMQPHWYEGELRKASMGNLLFTPEQAQLMRERIRAASKREVLERARQ